MKKIAELISQALLECYMTTPTINATPFGESDISLTSNQFYKAKQICAI